MANKTGKTHPSSASGVRLNKFLADAGLCSRRGADELIDAGRVRVNGRPPEKGLRVGPNDRVEVDGRPVAPPRGTPLYLLVHKPVQVVSTASDPQGRRTVMDLLGEEHRARRPFSVGRLDFFSEGLLLMTTDGDLANRLAHPSHHLPKTYHVRVRPIPDETALSTMRRGMTLAEGEKLAPVEAKVLKREAGTALVEMVLVQGVNRQIRRMARDLGLTILKLTRVAQGPVPLGKLPPGKVRELTALEIEKLKKAVGL